MGGPGSGRYKRKKDAPKHQTPLVQAADPTNIDASVNSKIIAFGKELIKFDTKRWDDPELLEKVFYDYLDLCDKYEIKPMVSSMAQAFGMNRKVLWGIATRNDHYKHWKGVTPECVDLIEKAYNFLQSYLEISLMDESKNPVKWFFLAKNYFGYQDQTVHVQRQETDVKILATPDEVAAKYALQVGRTQNATIEVQAEVIDSDSDGKN